MLIDLASSIIGDYDVRAGSPRIEAYYDVRLVPLRAFPDDDPFYGVYRQNGELIEAAAQMRGPGRILLGQSDRLNGTHNFSRAEGTGVYGGFGNLHFGHYLLSTLSRFWVNLLESHPGAKIYMHIVGDFDKWFDKPFVKYTMSALGYKKEDIIPIRTPIVLEHLLIPAPALVEQSHIYQVFADIGKIFNANSSIINNTQTNRNAVYFSKERLDYGVSKVQNETEITDYLQKEGVRVVYPEELALNEQIAIFQEHETIVGLAGSAFHLSILTTAAKRLIGICDKPQLNSNFLMIDAIKSNNSSYLYPEGRVRDLGRTDKFQNNYYFDDARKVADGILNRIM